MRPLWAAARLRPWIKRRPVSIGGLCPGRSPATGGILSGLRGFLDPQYALPIAAQLIGGATPQASFAGALSAAGPAFGDMRRKAAINAWLKARSTGTPLSPEMQQYIAQDPALAQKLAEHDLALDTTWRTLHHRPGTAMGAGRKATGISI